MNKLKANKIVVCILFGIIVGFINGFFGGGGGMLVVPLLIFFLKQEEKVAHATSVLCILPLSITSSVIYITKSSINYLNLGIVSVGVIVGGILGSLLLNKMNNLVLRFIFSAVMIFAGIKLMI